MPFIIGLGNPGAQYSETRHNIGRMIVERLGERHKVSFSKGPNAYQGYGSIGTHQVCLSLPQTWMNQTGVVVADLLRRFECTHRDLIVVYDDLDLSFGALRIKTRGGAGGHNGIRSILAHLETDQFYRLKVGIGHPPLGTDAAEYVLSPFSSSELSTMDTVLSRAVEALETIVLNGATVAMNRFNVQLKPKNEE